MEIEVVKNEKNEAEFMIKGNRHTYPALLQDRLLRDKSVMFAAYKLLHPMDSDARFIVKTSSKSPKKALQDAVKAIADDLDAFEKKLDKTVK